MKIDKDLKQVAKDVKKHPEWLEGMPEDLREIVDELNAEILESEHPEAKHTTEKSPTKRKKQ